MTRSRSPDCLIIGGGLVGLATAYQLSKRTPGLRLTVIEKERAVASHQSGRNSGVIHAGVYYAPGSLKARTCLEGRRELLEFCAAHRVPFETCGKVIVACDEREIAALEKLRARAAANGIAVERIDQRQLKELEPHAAGLAALHVPSTGIVDYRLVAAAIASHLRDQGHSIIVGQQVVGIEESARSVRVRMSDGHVHDGSFFVNCAGLHSDEVGRMCGVASDVIICPFRGEYYMLRPDAAKLCRNLIYPVPDARYPFLGVHFTRTVRGEVDCGPNAVFALGREAYRRGQIELSDLWRTFGFAGFWRFAAEHWRRGAVESWRSWCKSAFVRAAQQLLPALRAEHLLPGPSGIRAQALRRDGQLVDDFLIEQSQRGVHVLNAPSPAATASLGLTRTVAEVASGFVE